jgi:DNA-binding transcriptional regulator YiaG
VAKIEAAIKDAIMRGARRQVREAATPLRRDLRRVRRTLVALRADLAGLRDIAAHWQRVTESTPWQPEVSESELRSARMSPGLIVKLRARLRLTQSELARLVGVSAGAIAQWESGRASPAGPNRRRLVALRKLGRRDVRRLLKVTRKGPAARTRRPAAGRRRRRTRRGRRR